jgi:hypothetical protein
LDAFAAAPDIDFAYPTARQFRTFIEGKPSTRPTPDTRTTGYGNDAATV